MAAIFMENCGISENLFVRSISSHLIIFLFDFFVLVTTLMCQSSKRVAVTEVFVRQIRGRTKVVAMLDHLCREL